jgi:stearoyl-CoA desaturase (Delta-9 desaturase)
MPRLQEAVMFVSVVGPIVALVVAIVLFWHDRSVWGIGWPEIAVMVVMYGLTGFGITIGFHRLLTHRSFTTTRFVRLLLAVLGSCAAQGPVICWVATHRRHHQRSDREGDPHSPHVHGAGIVAGLRGFWHAHMGWVFEADKPGLARSVSDLIADPILLKIDRLYFFWIALGLIVPAAALGLWTHSWHGWLAGLIWGGLVRICLTQHATWSVNSVCHLWGGRPYSTSDQSKNNLPVALLSLGEGWHNNHHAFPTSARHGFTWWQFDSSYLIIKIMERLGLAWNVRLPAETRKHARAA